MSRTVKHAVYESTAIGSVFAAVYVLIALYDIQMLQWVVKPGASDPIVGSFGISVADSLLYFFLDMALLYCLLCYLYMRITLLNVYMKRSS